jgi:uncharacterized OB-fold protein
MEYAIAYFVITILALFGLAFIPAHIAGKKGYSAVGFYFFGLAFFMPALIVALCLTDKAEEARREARHRAEIAALRQTVSGGGVSSAPVSAPIQAATPEINPVCPACGHESGDGSRFCKACGARLNAVAPPPPPPTERRCLKCNTVYYEDDEFCGKCGAPLKDVDVVRVAPENGIVICPKCGVRQKGDRASCYKCGTRFEYEYS